MRLVNTLTTWSICKVNFTKPKKVVGLDIGSHSVKAVQVSRSGGGLVVEDVGYALIDRNELNSDPIMAHANAMREALDHLSVNQSMVVGALPGQTVVIRYPRLRNIDPADLGQAVQTEAAHNIPYDLSEVLLDWTLLEEEQDGDNTQLKVLMVAAKHEVIDSRVQYADAAQIQYGALSVDSLALADAAEKCQYLNGDESTALINIGASSVSIHFTNKGVSNFIRDINWGTKELVQAIAKFRHVDYETAENLLIKTVNEGESETDQEITETNESPTASDEVTDNASLLEPLSDELDSTPVDSSLGFEEDGAIGSGPVETPISELISTPIGRFVTEVRRSFDYYEHQLYEHPVEKVILSGGIAPLKQIQQALSNDLGINEVVVADPTNGAIKFSKKADMEKYGQHPSQYMVAVGLAARGIAEL
jgi:type IV pilus assembly protein PilM